MYTMTVAPGADVSGGFYFTESGVRRHARRPHGSRDHPSCPESTTKNYPSHARTSRSRAQDIPSDTVISFGDYGYEIAPDGISARTFRSYTFFVHAADVTLRNLTIENTAGDSKTRAGNRTLRRMRPFLSAESAAFSDRIRFYRSASPGRIRARRLPRADRSPAPRINGKTILSRNCYICGDIDFIFGSATAYFEGCTIASLGPGYVTAASTPPEGKEYGYVFHDCRFAAEVVLSTRPISAVPGGITHGLSSWTARWAPIHPAGFHDWGKEHARHRSFCQVSQLSTGHDAVAVQTAAARLHSDADFVDTLDGAQAAHFSRELVLAGDDGWLP